MDISHCVRSKLYFSMHLLAMNPLHMYLHVFLQFSTCITEALGFLNSVAWGNEA